MDIFSEINSARAYLSAKKSNQLSIGLVPTMGALHPGHLALIRASKAENDLTVCSIYVNPAQFNNSTDLSQYPRTLEADLALLKQEGCEMALIPTNEEMYAKAVPLRFDFGNLDKVMEGRYRPGHFSGVALVVAKFFNIVQPDRAYFGQKDYQQFQIISRLKEELKFPLELRSVPIVREPDGLAMSSRNQRLGATGRKKATLLFKSLNYARDSIRKGADFAQIRTEIEAWYRQEDGLKLEYLEMADGTTLELTDHFSPDKNLILLIAAYVDEVRLIDNLPA